MLKWFGSRDGGSDKLEWGPMEEGGGEIAKEVEDKAEVAAIVFYQQ